MEKREARVLLVSVVLAVSVLQVAAWGPYAHQSFARAAATANSTIVDESSYLLGAIAPDIFKHVSMDYHTWDFATELMTSRIPSCERRLRLFNSGRETLMRSIVATVSGKDFALGYGAHLAADQVGHQGGYLTPSVDHELEFAVDVLAYDDGLEGRSSRVKKLISLANDDDLSRWLPLLSCAFELHPDTVVTAISKFELLLSAERVAVHLFLRQLATDLVEKWQPNIPLSSAANCSVAAISAWISSGSVEQTLSQATLCSNHWKRFVRG